MLAADGMHLRSILTFDGVLGMVTGLDSGVISGTATSTARLSLRFSIALVMCSRSECFKLYITLCVHTLFLGHLNGHDDFL